VDLAGTCRWKAAGPPREEPGDTAFFRLLESPPLPSAAPADAGASLAATEEPPEPAEIEADLTWPGWRVRGVWSGSLGLGEVGAR